MILVCPFCGASNEIDSFTGVVTCCGPHPYGVRHVNQRPTPEVVGQGQALERADRGSNADNQSS